MSDHPPVKIPRVARAPRRGGTARLAVTLAVVGVVVFAALADGRAARGAQATELPPLAATAATAPTQFLPGSGVPAAPTIGSAIAPTPLPAALQRYSDGLSGTATRPNDGAAERTRARNAAPALIIELAQARSGEAPRSLAATPSDGSLPTSGSIGSQTDPSIQTGAGSPPGGAVSGAAVDPGARDLNSNERFSTRAGNRDTDVALARRLPNQATLVVQGTIFGAVMETALNSDLPGFARAVTSRDVLSFDGSQVMIPAGSHVIGEYNSGVAQGASRVFIVWTRLIRPDGVSIALASPAVDDLGRGGLGGKVNRHFLERFGGAILLSVLTGGLNAATQSLARGSTVVVSSASDATSLAGQATHGTDIAPTIKTPQGATVRIFVARDLDFSAVGPVS